MTTPTFPRFLSFGGVWLDEIRKDGQVVIPNVVGGSLTFAILGARLFTAQDPRRIRFIIIAGSDFLHEVVQGFRAWNVDLSIHWREDVPSSRGIVHYGKSESERTYERLTSPLNTDWSNLTLSEIWDMTAFHFFATPDMLTESVKMILDLRWHARASLQDPLIVWEPQAKSMRLDTLEHHLAAAKLVDVFSPNHAELASFFWNSQSNDTRFSKHQVEGQAQRFVEDGIRADGKGCAVIRCAEHGCLVMARDLPATWLPAYHDAASGKVVDSTGAGNAFLGAFAIGYEEKRSYLEAAKYAQVAASFVIEQVGLPSLQGEGVDETWNGVRVRDRLASYRERV